MKTKSKCCNADINIREEGVSQLSHNEFYSCSKCDKELFMYRVWDEGQPMSYIEADHKLEGAEILKYYEDRTSNNPIFT